MLRELADGPRRPCRARRGVPPGRGARRRCCRRWWREPGSAGASSASRPCSRRIENIWMPWMPEASRPLKEARQLAGAFGSRFGLLEMAFAQGDRRPDLLGCERTRTAASRGLRSRGTRRGRAAPPRAHPARSRWPTRQPTASDWISRSPSSSPRARASVSISTMSSSVLVPRVVYARARRIAEPTLVAEPTRHLDRVRADDRGARRGRRGRRATRARAESRGIRSVDSSPPRAALASSSSSSAARCDLPSPQQASSNPIAARASMSASPAARADLGDCGERLDRLRRAACCVAGGPELELDLRLLRWTLDAQPERGTEVGGRLLERERRYRRARRPEVVVDRPVHVAQGHLPPRDGAPRPPAP